MKYCHQEVHSSGETTTDIIPADSGVKQVGPNGNVRVWYGATKGEHTTHLYTSRNEDIIPEGCHPPVLFTADAVHFEKNSMCFERKVTPGADLILDDTAAAADEAVFIIETW